MTSDESDSDAPAAGAPDPAGGPDANPNAGTGERVRVQIRDGDAPTDAEAPSTGAGTVTVDEVRDHPHTRAYLNAADTYLKALGFSEHGERHATLVAKLASTVLEHLGHPQRQVELAAVAGLLHDVGNMVNRDRHAHLSALMAKDVLFDLGMPPAEVAQVMTAIGNHESEGGQATDAVTAALVLADKADVHRSRVHRRDRAAFDIHDRVNHAVTHSLLQVSPGDRVVTLELTIDPELATVLNYFEIFTKRMVFCRTASEVLGCTFALEVNGNRLS